MRISRTISVAVLVVASVAVYVWRQYHQAELLKAELLRPNVFSTADKKRWLFDSGYRYDFDGHMNHW